jgi:hypothetical protein
MIPAHSLAMSSSSVFFDSMSRCMRAGVDFAWSSICFFSSSRIWAWILAISCCSGVRALWGLVWAGLACGAAACCCSPAAADTGARTIAAATASGMKRASFFIDDLLPCEYANRNVVRAGCQVARDDVPPRAPGVRVLGHADSPEFDHKRWENLKKALAEGSLDGEHQEVGPP